MTSVVEVTTQRTIVAEGPGSERTVLAVTAPERVLELAVDGLQGVPGPAGPAGPQGPVGPQGPGALIQAEFAFAVPAATWQATHSLPISKPEVLCLDSSGEEILGDVTYPTPTSVRVDWAFPLAGTLVLYG
jgi:hypothetical protein